MGAAALPAGPSEHRGDGVLQPLVGIGGYQLHSAEAPSGQRPQEGQPEGAVLAGPHVHTQDLTLPFGIDPRTKAYMCRRTGEGMSKTEVIRCLKRYIAREVFSALQNSAAIISSAA